ncbi:hypothetical protein [Kordia antarctica]|nr:hypothetical protein [Kordia antarctica]
MKKSLLLLVLIFGLQKAGADCMGSGMTFYPLEKEINRNSMFIIEGYAMSKKTIKSFHNRKVYLQSGTGELVELKLQEILYSSFSLAQAIFIPSKTLQPNTKYSLKYENQTDSETIELQHRFYGGKKPLYWITTNQKYSTKLRTSITTTYKESIVEQYGCGPAVYAVFDVKNDPNKQAWYKTELLDVSTNTTKVYYIKSNNNKLSVGHGMCSGAFSFSRKGDYKVRFTPVNSDGKTSKATDWIPFKSPFMESINKNGF